MGDVEGPSELVSRLHSLRVKRGLTVQQMAERCGIPKSSLESYMKMSGAKRPGVDALIAIADGMDTSIDWIVGRSRSENAETFTKEEYAVFVNSAVTRLLTQLIQVANESPLKALDPANEKVLGREANQIAALVMFDFLERIERQAGPSERPKGPVGRLLSELEKQALERALSPLVSHAPGRKPETD